MKDEHDAYDRQKTEYDLPYRWLATAEQGFEYGREEADQSEADDTDTDVGCLNAAIEKHPMHSHEHTTPGYKQGVAKRDNWQQTERRTAPSVHEGEQRNGYDKSEHHPIPDQWQLRE